MDLLASRISASWKRFVTKPFSSYMSRNPVMRLGLLRQRTYGRPTVRKMIKVHSKPHNPQAKSDTGIAYLHPTPSTLNLNFPSTLNPNP